MEMRTPFADPLDMALAREMQAGERVLWEGKPLPRIAVGGFGLYFFAIPWTAFALFWTAMAFTGVQAELDDTGWIALAFPLFGTPFIAVGLGMLALPFLPLFGAEKTIFAITSKRVLRLYLGGKLRSESVALEQIGEIQRSEKSDGSGTLRIESGTVYAARRGRSTRQLEIGEVGNVIEAEDRLRQALERIRANQL